MTTPTLSNVSSPLRVLIVQRRLTHYRVKLFELLRDNLQRQGVQLQLSIGEASPTEKLKNDGGVLEWAAPLATRYWLGERLCWQPFAHAQRAGGAQLVIIPQENRLVYNLIALFLRRPPRLAFWGHGANLQSTRPDGARERFKRWTGRRVDWWFGYTESTRNGLQQQGFPPDRITVLNNAIDTGTLQRQLAAIDADALRGFMRAHDLSPGRTVLYIGSLYREKRLDLLLDAASRIHHALPDVRLLIAGDGPERAWLTHALASRPWARWLGLCLENDKALALKASSLILNPALVGLSLLDAFVAGTPMVTTHKPGHGPEIAYLDPGRNGLMAPADAAGFAAAVVALLEQPQRLADMSAAALASAEAFSLEAMVDRFGRGIVQCLEQTPPRRATHH